MLLERSGGPMHVLSSPRMHIDGNFHLLIEAMRYSHQTVDREAIKVALRMREKVAAVVPVTSCPLRTVIPVSSSDLP